MHFFLSFSFKTDQMKNPKGKKSEKKINCQHNTVQSFIDLCSEWIIMVATHH